MSFLNKKTKLILVLIIITVLGLGYRVLFPPLTEEDISLTVTHDPRGMAPLSAEAEITLPCCRPVSVTVTVLGKPATDSTPEGISITHTFTGRQETFTLPILGLYPDHNNRIEFIFRSDDENDRDDREILLTHEITTPPLENTLEGKDIVPIEIMVNRLNPLDQGVYLVDNLKIAFDQYGEIRWAYTGDSFLNYGKLQNGNLIITSGEDIRMLYHYPRFYEVTPLGETVRTYDLSDYYGHHDVWEITVGPQQGNLLVAANESTPHLDDKIAGNDGVGEEDIILLMDRETGEVTKVWDAKKLFTADSPNTHRFPREPRVHPDDWIHMNAVYHDPEDNSIVFSARHLSAIVKMDFDSGRLIWIMADNSPQHWDRQTNFYGQVIADYLLKPIDFEGRIIDDPGAEDFWAYGQHAVKRIGGEGGQENIFIFDNGNYRNFFQYGKNREKKYFSRAVEYLVNRDDMTVKKIWEFDAGRKHYTIATGSTDLLPNGNRLIGFMWISEDKATPRVFELNPDGETVFEALFNEGKDFYYQVEKFDLYQGLE